MAARTRGERQYVRMPRFAARLYDNLTSVGGVPRGFREIAAFLAGRVPEGTLLDAGTGPGRLLREVHAAAPALRLFGLDIAASMIDLARANLHDVPGVDLRVGSIAATGYPSGFFDAVVSTGSFYNWDDPVAGLDEIHRILRPGRSGYIFETVSDSDRDLLRVQLTRNLEGAGPLRRAVSRAFLNKQLHMTYTRGQIVDLVAASRFAGTARVEPVEVGGLPIYVRIELPKPGD
jgi:SAM-dependent methyltransferase